MRIGILTLPLHTNYGGILQAYALQTVLERMGHQVVVFDKPFEYTPLPIWKMPYVYTKRLIKKYILRDGTEIFQEQNGYRRSVISRKYTQPFIEKYIHRYIYRGFSDIKESDFDAIVVGSDQIWRMMYVALFFGKGMEPNVFLNFTEGWKIKRISYAASFGTDRLELEGHKLNLCRKAIQRFDGVSVREKSGVDICREDFDIPASWVLDPTMLLKSSDYLKFTNSILSSTGKRYLTTYILDESPEIDDLITKIAKEKKLELLKTNIPETGRKGESVPQPPLENWLSAIYNADYVINDSFHACVFSILFHKQFTVIANEKRGLSRFKSLLSIFGLEDRIISSPKEYHELPDIDYTHVDKILNKKKDESIGFLEKFLK